MNSGKVVLGVLAGIATGAVLGVLFAPEKGSDTRKNISKKGEDLINALNHKIDDKFNDLMHSITGRTRKSASQNDSVFSSKSEMVN